MPSTCQIILEPERLLIRMTLAGFFTLEDVRRFDQERQLAIGKLRCGINQHFTLCDVSGCELSTPDVAAALQRVIGNPIFRSRKCAMVVRGALARLQAKRVVQRQDIQMFDQIADAEAWLMEEAPAPRRVA